MESRPVIGPAGRLDSRWDGPAEGSPVLLLHPHPAHGGSMGSRFVYDLAQVLVENDHRVVRFDFRGVKRSEGSYGRGTGEIEDALAVYDVLAEETGRAPIVIGHSFGGSVALHVAAVRDAAAVIAVAAPSRVRDSDIDSLDVAGDVRCPAGFVIGDADQQVMPEDALRVARAVPQLLGIRRLDGIGHFLHPDDNPAGIMAVLSLLSPP